MNISPVIVGYNKFIYAVLHVAELHRTPLTSILVFLITLKTLTQLSEKTMENKVDVYLHT
jgi:hypothetical protein